MNGDRERMEELLDRSIASRRARAALRTRVRENPSAGLAELALVLTEPPWWAETLTLGKVLEWVPKLGPVRRRRLLMALGLHDDEVTHLADVSITGARELAATLQSWSEEARAA